MARRRTTLTAFLAVISLVVFTPTPKAGAAAVFLVNSTADAVDVAPGDGVCSAAGGKCTLRAAVMEANALAGNITVELPAGTYRLVLPGAGEDAATTGDLDITGHLFLDGAGDGVTVIDANGLDRVVHVLPGSETVIHGVHMTGGSVGGGVHNSGVLTLIESSVSNSKADEGAGGIGNDGSLRVLASLIFENVTGMGGAGVHSSGGSLRIERSAVFDNGQCAVTGGIRSYATESVIVDSYVGFNNAPSCGYSGGISNDGGGTMTVVGTTVEGNHGLEGGGINNFDGQLTVVNSTITDNSSDDLGGGLYFRSGSVALANVTIAGNSSAIGGGVHSQSGSTVGMANSILADNLAGKGSDCFGTVTSHDYNLVGATANCTLAGGATHDLTDVDPKLGSLQNNGGLTDTRALLPGSPAINAGNPATPGSGSASCAPNDQRGVSRPQGGRCDIGAYEVQDSFTDDDGNTFEADIEWLASEGITKGCNPPANTLFCPDDFVTRGQMAAFLHRALDDVLTQTDQVDFVDDDGNTFEADIEWLGGTGVTKGCNPPTNNKYCPDDYVTRGQMAAFLVRALGYTDNGGGNLFIDDNGHTFEADIDKLGTAGVTKGCNPPTNDRFCPNDFVTRGQMAAFLHRALGK